MNSKRNLWIIGVLLLFPISYFLFFSKDNSHIPVSSRLQNVLEKTVDGKKIFWTSFAIKFNDFIWQWSAWNISQNQPYFIASTTKLFTTALILQLQSQNKLQFNDPIHLYIEKEILDGLHIYKWTDFSQEITIQHLLSHTSWLPDYFQTKKENGESLKDELVKWNDQGWSFEESIQNSKTLSPLFIPWTEWEAYYSDTNFQLLGKIIENITQKSYEENCKEFIFTPLKLKDTYLFTNISDTLPLHLYYRENPLFIPKAMSSFGPDWWIVSTSSDMLVFIEWFFTGKLFPKENLENLQQWNDIFFPMQSWVWFHKFEIPWIFDPTKSMPIFIWHSGLSGALAFFIPEKNIFIAGTVNQIDSPEISFITMIWLVRELLQ